MDKLKIIFGGNYTMPLPLSSSSANKHNMNKILGRCLTLFPRTDHVRVDKLYLQKILLDINRFLTHEADDKNVKYNLTTVLRTRTLRALQSNAVMQIVSTVQLQRRNVH